MFSVRIPELTELRLIPIKRVRGEVCCPREKFKSWVEIKGKKSMLNLAIMATTGNSSAVILTSGASDRVSALFSLRNLRRLLFSVQTLFLWVFMLFQRPSPSENAEDGNSQTLLYLKSVKKLTIQRRKKVFRDEEEDVCRRRALAMKSREFPGSAWKYYLFQNPKGETLFYQSWTPTSRDIKAVLILLHGLNEHSGRYKHFARQLNSCGYKVYGVDWIGHGGSDGLHGYVPSLDEVVKDAKLLLQNIRSENHGIPCFLFGHSTGGAIILKAALDPSVEEMVKGIVITSPALRVWTAHPMFEVIAPLFSLLLPRYQFGGASKGGTAVSRDPEVLKSKYSDPLVYTGPIRVRTGCEILRICSFLQQNMKRLTIPFLVLHGASDAVTDPNASQDLYDQASSEHKAIKLYDGLLHDLLFEPERNAIASDILDWMDGRLDS